MFFFDKIKEDGNSYIIRGFPREHFARKLKKHYNSSRLNKLFEAVGMTMFSNGSIKVHKFFVPELIYLLRKFEYPSRLINDIVNNTWVKYISGEGVKDRIDLHRIKATMRVKLLPHQQEFITSYDIEKQKYQLNGYILGFDPGLGKTLTGLALMMALGKKKIIIIAPKSTLESVWERHINDFFVRKMKIAIVNRDNMDPSSDVLIYNYESMGKINEIVKTLATGGQDIGIIVDESHNFLRLDSNRTQDLISLRSDLGCTDMLLMSGTPVKAIGLEIMPMLMVLDPFFDEEAVTLYKAAFGVNTNIATDVLRARLSVMMHRKTKEELLKLPPKVEQTIKVSIPTGNNYTLDAVKNAVSVFVDQRFAFHAARMDQYLKDFYVVMEWLKKNTNLAKEADFAKYLGLVITMRRVRVDLRDAQTAEYVKWANLYEKNTIIPLLPKEQKQQFTEAKSAVKYVHLKIRGEVIGQLLMQLRMQMTSEMVHYSNIEQLINNSLKKTVIFTSYVDTVECAEGYLREKGFTPLLVYGKTSGDVKSLLDTFNNDPGANPLVASIQSLSTGVTMTVANTVIFLNKPWRHTDYLQASDRVHRIGQNADVFIISIILDTGTKDNLSTRMEDVMEWTKSQFMELVGDTPE